MLRKDFLCFTLLAGLGATSGLRNANAAEFPERPMRLFNPFAPGSSVDVVARTMAEKMGPRLGQMVTMEYFPGASGSVAATSVARGAKDGYTMLIGTSSSLGFLKSVNKDLTYDPVRDFTPIAVLANVPIGIFVNVALGINTLQELVAAAKAKPKAFNYGNTGQLGLTHLAGEMLCYRAGIEMVPVPYTGASARYWNDLVGGQLQVVIAGVTGGLPLAKAGRIKLIATATRERSKQLPNVPAVGEVYAGYDAPAWLGLAVARGTPPAIVAKLEAAALAVLAEPSTRIAFEATGVDLADPILGSHAFAAKIGDDVKMWEDMLRASGLIKS